MSGLGIGHPKVLQKLFQQPDCVIMELDVCRMVNTFSSLGVPTVVSSLPFSTVA